MKPVAEKTGDNTEIQKTGHEEQVCRGGTGIKNGAGQTHGRTQIINKST